MPVFGALCLNLSLVVLSFATPLFFRARGAGGVGLSTARHLFAATVAFVTAAVVVLSLAAVTHDFRIEYIASYTDRTTEVAYLLSAVWAGQAGSLIVWACMLGWMGLALGGRLRQHAPELEPAAMGALSLLFFFFIAVMVGWSNPFAITPGEPPVDGNGLNPLLRNFLMIFHPPALLAGYAAYGPPAAITAAAMITNRIDRTFLRELRHWALIAWVFLTIGNVLGMLWAYEELGWGGYWGWDPVENASLIPWLTGTALLHLLLVERRAGLLRGYGALLALVTFWLTLFGTYLTRSGIVASVHAFGHTVVADAFAILLVMTAVAIVVGFILRRRMLAPPTWGKTVVIGRASVMLSLLIFALELEGALGLIAASALITVVVGWRGVQRSLRESLPDWVTSMAMAVAVAGVIEPALWLSGGLGLLLALGVGAATGAADRQTLPAIVSRAALLTSTVGVLVAIALGVAFGTVLPVTSRLVIGEAVQVDASWYVEWAVPAGLVLLFATGICLSLGWKPPDWPALRRRLAPAVGVSLLVLSGALSLGVTHHLALAAMALAGLAAAAGAIRAVRLLGTTRRDTAGSSANVRRLLRGLGAVLGHVGFAVILFGVAGEANKLEETVLLSVEGDTAQLGGYRLELDSVRRRFEIEREVLDATIFVTDEAGRRSLLAPARHRYRTHSNQPTSEAAVLSSVGGDLFLTLGQSELREQRVWVRAVYTPLLIWIWIGCALMAFGGVLVVSSALRPSRRGAAVGFGVSVLALGLGYGLRISTALLAVVGFLLALALWWLARAVVLPVFAAAGPQEESTSARTSSSAQVEAAPRSCPECGVELIAESEFCHRCGTKITEDEVPS